MLPAAGDHADRLRGDDDGVGAEAGRQAGDHRGHYLLLSDGHLRLVVVLSFFLDFSSPMTAEEFEDKLAVA